MGLTMKMRHRQVQVSNLWRTVRFDLDGQVFVRRLMPVVEGVEDISSESPVGRALVLARVGERVVVEAPGGDVVVKVLGIDDHIIGQDGEAG